MIYRLSDPKEAAPLFEGWEETVIWSCLSGVMGSVYTDTPETFSSAAAMLGSFRFFAGKPSRELALFHPEGQTNNSFIAVPHDEKWLALLGECYGKRAYPSVRYATKKEPDVFDRGHLARAARSLPAGYRLEWIGLELFARCGNTPWCADWVRQYRDYEHFLRYGLGVVVMKDGELVAGASSYSGWPGGIEVEIDTRVDHQRKGLAYAAGAALILECLDRGWYPSWDAQNPGSLALAEKLGYHFSHQYPVYVVTEN